MEIGLLGLLIIIALATYFKKSFESDTVDYGKKISELEKSVASKEEIINQIQKSEGLLNAKMTSFEQLKTDFVYYTSGFYKQVEFAYPIEIGGYKAIGKSDSPMVLHMCHVPWIPDVKGSDQWRAGRYSVLTTTFQQYENHVKKQLLQALRQNYNFV